MPVSLNLIVALRDAQPVKRKVPCRWHEKGTLQMTRLIPAVLAVLLAIGATTATAQSNAPVEESTEAETVASTSEWLVPMVVGIIVFCAILCGDDDTPAVELPSEEG
jgi:hypothetical protein